MKQMKRISATTVSGVLALSLVFSGTAGIDSSAKAKKATLKTKSITVKAGKTKKIVIVNKKKGKYTFTSGKRTIATVNKKGVVKGVKAGDTKVICTATKNCRITLRSRANAIFSVIKVSAKWTPNNSGIPL